MDILAPPQSVDLEAAVLGGIICEPEAIKCVKLSLIPQDFYLDPHKQIFRAMLDLAGRGIQPDAIALRDYLTDAGTLDQIGGPGYIYGLMNTVASGAGVEHHALLVKEKARQRGVLQAIEEVRGQLYNTSTSADGAIQTLRQRFELIAGGAGDGTIRTEDELAAAWLEQLSRGQQEVTTTGYDWLDALTGGWSAGDLWIWSARTNTGKTRMLIPWLLKTCSAGTPCGLISLDMAANRLVKYLLSSDNALAGYPTHMDPREMVVLGRTNVAPGVSYFKAKLGVNLYVVPEPRNDYLSLEGYIRTLVNKFKCKVVAIDQAQNFRDYNQEDRQSVGAVVKACKDWARHYGISIVLVHQINREGYSQPSLKNLKDSSCFAEYSDFVVILHDRAKAILDTTGCIVEDEKNPGQYRPAKDSDPADVRLYQVPTTRIIRFALEKSRHGDTAARGLRFDFAQGVTVE